MANIAISSSMVATSKIYQKAQFTFPIKFPLAFNFVNFTVSCKEVSSLTVASNIQGILKSIIPVSGGVASRINFNVSIINKLVLATLGLRETSTIGPISLKSQVILNGHTVSTSTLMGKITNIVLINGLLPSSIIVSTQSTNNLRLIGHISPSSTLSGHMSLNVDLNSQIKATSILNATVSVQLLIVPQTINATSTVTGIATTIFKLITNIIANTSIAGISTLQKRLNGNLTSITNIQGIIYDLISASLNAKSNPDNTFNFPLAFPFNFGKEVLASLKLGSNVSPTSSIVDNSINDLLAVSFIESSNISGSVSCTYNGVEEIISSSSITASITSKISPISNVVSSTAISPTITDALNEVCNISSATVAYGTLIATQKAASGVISNASVSANILNGIVDGGNLIAILNIPSTNIFQHSNIVSIISSNSAATATLGLTSNLLSSITSASIIQAQYAVQFTEQSNIASNTSIAGIVYLSIGSNVTAQSAILLSQVFNFPITFPLVFNDNITKGMPLESLLEIETNIVNISICDLMQALLQSSSSIESIITEEISLYGELISNTIISTNLTTKIVLEGQIEAYSSISATATLKLNLTEQLNEIATCTALSTLQADCNGSIVDSTEIVGKLFNLISCRLDVVSSIDLPQTFGFNWTFPFVFLDNISKGFSLVAKPITATSMITGDICSLNYTNVHCNSNIEGTIGSELLEQSNLIISTSISGTLNNLASSSMEQDSIIDFAKTFSFPVAFPFIFESGIVNQIQIASSSLMATSEIMAQINSVRINKIEATSVINAILSDLINSSLDIESSIDFSNTMVFPLDFPLRFKRGIINNIQMGNTQLTADVLINANIYDLIRASIESTSIINGVLNKDIHLQSSLIVTSNIANSSFTGSIPLSSNVSAQSTISSMLLSNIKLHGSVACTALITKITITEKNTVIFEVYISEKTIIPSNTLTVLCLVNTFGAAISSTKILQTKSIESNLQGKCIFYCTQNSMVYISNENNTVLLVANLTKKIIFNSYIASSQALNVNKYEYTRITDIIINTKF